MRKLAWSGTDDCCRLVVISFARPCVPRLVRPAAAAFASRSQNPCLIQNLYLNLSPSLSPNQNLNQSLNQYPSRSLSLHPNAALWIVHAGSRTFLANARRLRRKSAWRWHESRALGGMHNPQGSSVLEHALAAATLSRPLVERIQRKDRDLASQVRRAVSSIALNLAEGCNNASGNGRLRFESALGSLYEARAGIRLAVAWGYVLQAAADEALDFLHCLGGRIYGLARK